MVSTPAGINPYTGDPNWQRLASRLIGPQSNLIGIDDNGALIYLGTNSSALSLSPIAPLYMNGTTIGLHYSSPLVAPSGTLSLSSAAPFYLNGGTLSLHMGTGLALSGTDLEVRLGANLPLTASGSMFSLSYASPLYVNDDDDLDILLGSGLRLTMMGALTVDLTAIAPLGLTSGTLTIGLDAPLYLSQSTHQLELRLADPLQITGGSLGLKYHASYGLKLESGQLAINVSSGLGFDSGALYVTLAADGNLDVNNSDELLVVTEDSGVQNLATGDISWWLAAGSPAGSLSTGNYRWTRIANIVHFWFRVAWSQSQNAVCGCEIYLPAGAPTPTTFSTSNSEIETYGSGGLAYTAEGDNLTSTRPRGSYAALSKNSSGNWVVGAYAPQDSYADYVKYAWAHVTYLAD
jgi:hypothetical protein